MTRRRRRGIAWNDRYVKLPYWMMSSAAWRNLDTVARCAYIELLRRYRGPGSNNGRIPYSVREMAEALHVSKATALRAFRILRERGFIVEMKRGAFSLKVRHATEWRLTEFMCDVTGQLSTKDFMRWGKDNAGLPISKKQNTGVEAEPYGFQDETVRVSR